MTEQVFGTRVTLRRGDTIKVCFQEIVRTDSDKTLGLNIDMCENKNLSWDGKETFQLNISEISYFAAYWLKLVDDVNFAYHGSNKNRSLTIKRKTKDRVSYHQMSLWQAGKGLHYINICDTEGFGIFNMLLFTLAKQYKISISECINLLKVYYQ